MMEKRSYVPNYEIRDKFDRLFKVVIGGMQSSKVCDMNSRSVDYNRLDSLAWFLCQCGVFTYEEFKKYHNALIRVLEDCLVHCTSTPCSEANISGTKDFISSVF